jgi:hypothetical protein
MMSRLFTALLFAAAIAQAQAPITNLLITIDPPEGGKQVVTVNLTPTATLTAELIEAVCQYQQEFNWPPKAEKQTRRITKPAIFTFRAKDVKFVDGLDLHLSFFVPVDIAELREKHGTTAFTPLAPATISSVTVTAYQTNAPLWTFQAAPVTNLQDGVLR